MASFAHIEYGIVVNVISVADEDCPGSFPDSEATGQAFIASLGLLGEWRQTFPDRSYRKNFAYIDCKYDTERDAFITPQPYQSWVLDEATCQWQAPIPMPTPNNPPFYGWDEDTLSWTE